MTITWQVVFCTIYTVYVFTYFTLLIIRISVYALMFWTLLTSTIFCYLLPSCTRLFYTNGLLVCCHLIILTFFATTILCSLLSFWAYWVYAWKRVGWNLVVIACLTITFFIYKLIHLTICTILWNTSSRIFWILVLFTGTFFTISVKSYFWIFFTFMTYAFCHANVNIRHFIIIASCTSTSL
jgi:hypothetical protein